jgi:hypothetical protein
MSTVRFEMPEKALQDLDKKLAGLGMVAQSKVLLDGMRSAGRAVRTRGQELAPVKKDELEAAFAVGLISDKTVASWRKARATAKKTALKTDAAWKIKAFLRRDEPILEVRVKAAKRAPHFHLVELGHEVHAPRVLFVSGGKVVTRKGAATRKVGKRTKPTRFLSRGGKYSKPQQLEAMQTAARKAITKLIGA